MASICDSIPESSLKSCFSRKAIPEGHMRLDHGSDIAVFQDHAFALVRLSQHNIQHCPGQVIGANDLVREQNPEYRIDRAQQSVAEVRFVPRLDGVDICRPEKVNMRETRR